MPPDNKHCFSLYQSSMCVLKIKLYCRRRSILYLSNTYIINGIKRGDTYYEENNSSVYDIQTIAPMPHTHQEGFRFVGFIFVCHHIVFYVF